MELDAKGRVQRANRARPRRQLVNQVFSEGQPVVVWRQGRRGALAKVGPCFVILQRGSTVWVTRRGELWKCNASQVFAMGPLEVQGLEVIPKDLLMAKERLRFDSEKLGFVDVEQENVEGDDLDRSPLDGRGTQRPEPQPVEGAEVTPLHPSAAASEDDLPSDLDSYAPSLAEPHGSQARDENQAGPSEPPGPQARDENRAGPSEPPGPQARNENRADLQNHLDHKHGTRTNHLDHKRGQPTEQKQAGRQRLPRVHHRLPQRQGVGNGVRQVPSRCGSAMTTTQQDSESLAARAGPV